MNAMYSTALFLKKDRLKDFRTILDSAYDAIFASDDFLDEYEKDGVFAWFAPDDAEGALLGNESVRAALQKLGEGNYYFISVPEPLYPDGGKPATGGGMAAEAGAAFQPWLVVNVYSTQFADSLASNTEMDCSGLEKDLAFYALFLTAGAWEKFNTSGDSTIREMVKKGLGYHERDEDSGTHMFLLYNMPGLGSQKCGAFREYFAKTAANERLFVAMPQLEAIKTINPDNFKSRIGALPEVEGNAKLAKYIEFYLTQELDLLK